jgi:cytochrome c-type biogenesis protein CcmH/NrfF
MWDGTRALVLLCALLFALPAGGDELANSRRARGLADELMSPFCPGRTLSDCPSPNASAVREEIRAWVGEGRSDAEIRERLRDRFGDSLAGEPQSAWGRVLPIAAIAGVGLLFAVGLRRVVARSPDPRDR